MRSSSRPRRERQRAQHCSRLGSICMISCMNSSFNIRTRQGGSGRLGHDYADRRHDVRGCLACMNGCIVKYDPYYRYAGRTVPILTGRHVSPDHSVRHKQDACKKDPDPTDAHTPTEDRRRRGIDDGRYNTAPRDRAQFRQSDTRPCTYPRGAASAVVVS
eukprot:4726276-Prymnesium_polylepis.1